MMRVGVGFCDVVRVFNEFGVWFFIITLEI
jgi:hypothetical protein